VKAPPPGALLTIDQELELAVAEDALEADVISAVLAAGPSIKQAKPKGEQRTRRNSRAWARGGVGAQPHDLLATGVCARSSTCGVCGVDPSVTKAPATL
jgi:hypothetical protein